MLITRKNVSGWLPSDAELLTTQKKLCSLFHLMCAFTREICLGSALSFCGRNPSMTEIWLWDERLTETLLSCSFYLAVLI